MTSPLTYSSAEVAAMIPCEKKWLEAQLRAGRFPGCKIANRWRMTQDDITRTLEICANARHVTQLRALSVAPESQRRIRRS